LGHTFDSYGGPSADKFVGGCIFVDHASGFLHVEHQVGFSAVETIWATQNFEKLCLDHGVIVNNYLANSGVFKSNDFVQHINEHQQQLRFCGTNSHHQNGVARKRYSICLKYSKSHASSRIGSFER